MGIPNSTTVFVINYNAIPSCPRWLIYHAILVLRELTWKSEPHLLETEYTTSGNTTDDSQDVPGRRSLNYSPAIHVRFKPLL